MTVYLTVNYVNVHVVFMKLWDVDLKIIVWLFIAPDSWTVNLDLSVDEYFKDEPVKRVLTRFPVNIVRMETDLQNNPWGLGFNCYSSIPLRLEAKEFREGDNQ